MNNTSLTTLGRAVWSIVLLAISMLAFGQRYLYVSDWDTRSIKRFDATTGAFVDEIVPAGTGGLGNVQAFAFSGNGVLYAGDYYSGVVKKYDARTGAYLGDLFAPHAGGLQYPSLIAVGANGTVWVVDDFTVKGFDGTTGAYLGDLPMPPEAAGHHVSAIRVMSGNVLYVNMTLQGQSYMVLRFNANTGAFVDTFIPASSGSATHGHGMAFGPDGNFYVTDQLYRSVHRFNGATGAYMGDFVPPLYGGIYEPVFCDFGYDGNLYVSNWTGGPNVLKYDGSTGASLGEFISASSGLLSGPYQMEFHELPVAPNYVVSPLFDQTKSHRRGSTVPIKLQVLDGSGANVSSPNLAVHAVSVEMVTGAAPGPLEDSGAANPDFNFRYDPDLGAGGGYIFNLSLKGYSTGTYKLNFTIGSDPTLRSVQFQVK